MLFHNHYRPRFPGPFFCSCAKFSTSGSFRHMIKTVTSVTTKYQPVSTTTTIPKILYVDDDSDDCIFLTESFAAVTSSHTRLVCASGGKEAISYLCTAEEDRIPSLNIMDLN